MQRVEKTVDTGLLLEEYRTLLETVDQLPLTITGSSMTPFLAPGRDSVMLTKPRRPLQTGGKTALMCSTVFCGRSRTARFPSSATAKPTWKPEFGKIKFSRWCNPPPGRENGRNPAAFGGSSSPTFGFI